MKIKAGIFPAILILSLILSRSVVSLIALVAALLHESGHIAAARILGIRLREMDLGIFGAALLTDGELCSYRKEIILCAAGPATNFLCAALVFAVMQSGLFSVAEEYLSAFVRSSVSLGILNLLPVTGFDGGRILSSLLLLRFQPHTVSCIMSVLSFVCVFSLWCISLYLLLHNASSLSLFVFSAALFSRLFIRRDD